MELRCRAELKKNYKSGNKNVMKQKNLSELLRTLQKLTAVHLAEFISWDAKEIIILSLIKYQHL